VHAGAVRRSPRGAAERPLCRVRQPWASPRESSAHNRRHGSAE
jgi:hypothetical protein